MTTPTNLTELSFVDGADCTVTLVDAHSFTSVSALEIQEHGLMYDDPADGVRLFIPWHFVQSITQPLPG